MSTVADLRERLWRAKERTAGLLKANLALRLSADKLVEIMRIKDKLAVALRHAVAAAGVNIGGVLRRTGATSFAFIAIFDSGHIVCADGLRDLPIAPALPD